MESQIQQLANFLNRLDETGINYLLVRAREESVVMVLVHVPGQYWEVEFMPDGSVEVERFRSDGSIGDAGLLDELFRDFSA